MRIFYQMTDTNTNISTPIEQMTLEQIEDQITRLQTEKMRLSRRLRLLNAEKRKRRFQQTRAQLNARLELLDEQLQ
jgi:hypothetical protein